MSIGMSPFKSIYHYDALSFIDVVFGDNNTLGDKDWIQESQEILKALMDTLQVVQNELKLYENFH